MMNKYIVIVRQVSGHTFGDAAKLFVSSKTYQFSLSAKQDDFRTLVSISLRYKLLLI